MSSGKLFVISGPSGVGKGTLVSEIMKRNPDFWLSISATTRSPRDGEVDGESYIFLTRKDFEDLICENGFCEWAEYSGNLYGTPLEPMKKMMAAGKTVVLEIEVQGAEKVKQSIPDAKLIFIAPPSREVLKERLLMRATESEEAISRRMETALVEIDKSKEYDIVIVNDKLEDAVIEIEEYMRSV